MKAIDVPARFRQGFGFDAGPGFIRPIPFESQAGIEPGAASITDGFPPPTFLPIAAGGIPPDGRDFNGLLNRITLWSRWQAAGVAAAYDAGFATEMGGYPKGSLVLLTQGHIIAKSTIDDNLANPNTSFAGWEIMSCSWSQTAWTATGSANAQRVNPNIVPTSLAQLTGIPLTFRAVGTTTGPATLKVSSLDPVPILQPNGAPMAAASIRSGSYVTVVYDGSNFIRTSASSVFSDTVSLNGGVAINGAPSANGANLQLVGNGGATPRKFIRARSGALSVVNDAYTAEILNLSDLGVLFAPFMKAGAGAMGTGDVLRVTNLADFPSGSSAAGVWMQLPNDWIIQIMGFSISGGVTNQVQNFARAFPTLCFGVFGNFGSALASLGAGGAAPQATLGLSAISLSQFEATNTGNDPGSPYGVTAIAFGK